MLFLSRYILNIVRAQCLTKISSMRNQAQLFALVKLLHEMSIEQSFDNSLFNTLKNLHFATNKIIKLIILINNYKKP